MNYDERIAELESRKIGGRRYVEPYQLKRINKEIRYMRLQAAREKGTHTDAEWLAVLAEFDYRCVQCGCYPDPRPCKDHIVPIYQGGSDGIDNLQPLCRECNSSKGPDAFNWAEYRRQHGFEAAA